jgi:hypothetical protein
MYQIRKKYTFRVHDHTELHIRKFPKSSNNKCDRLFHVYVTAALHTESRHTKSVESSFRPSCRQNQSAASKVPRRDERSELRLPAINRHCFPEQQIFGNIETKIKHSLWAIEQTKYDLFNLALDEIQNNQ